MNTLCFHFAFHKLRLLAAGDDAKGKTGRVMSQVFSASHSVFLAFLSCLKRSSFCFRHSRISYFLATETQCKCRRLL